MRRSRDEPPADSHAPSRDAVMQGFAVWRAGRAAPVQSPLKRTRRSLWAILTGRRPADPFVLDDARLQAVISEVRDAHPRFELDEAPSAPDPQHGDAASELRLRPR